PGRVRAEINSHQYDLHSLGGVGFQQTAQRIHRLLFDEEVETGPAAELGFQDIRIAYRGAKPRVFPPPGERNTKSPCNRCPACSWSASCASANASGNTAGCASR